MSPDEQMDHENDALSPEFLALVDRVTKAVPDLYAWQIILPADGFVSLVLAHVQMLEEDTDARLEYMGNWWVSGNPYKGVNCVFVVAKNARRFEIQYHTPESADLAQKNHHLYEIERDAKRSLAERQEAYDEMVKRFANIPHPPNVDQLGELVVKSRPVSSVEHERHMHDHANQWLQALAHKIAAEVPGVTISQRAEYPADLQGLLDASLNYGDAGDDERALLALDELIDRYISDAYEDGIAQGVTLALLRSGVILANLSRYDEALARCDKALEICADEYAGQLLGMWTRQDQAKEVMQQIRRQMIEQPAVQQIIKALYDESVEYYGRKPRESDDVQKSQGGPVSKLGLYSRMRRWFFR
ncbi:hypothetical protein [Nonomuraea sp. NPDC005650]|uniref:tetratricopeptide repeat protein n=1 Tax=Nonomuraea sp. NPDC005650 TaxID=3157045 RepID=UPI0033BA7F0A